MHPKLPWSHLQQRMDERITRGLWRKRTQRPGPQTPGQQLDGRAVLSFCSNDYLGLASHPEVVAALRRGAEKYGVGSGGSHVVTGHCRVHDQLEAELADFLQRDRALLFSSGYMANTGIINALMSAGGVVFQDALNHASLLDGGWLCRADSRRYPHADTGVLRQMLQQSDATHTLLVSDGLFSMDGDVAPLDELVRLAQMHNALLMVDDAHGIGALGAGGRGVIELTGSTAESPHLLGQRQVPLLVGTLGKSFGTAGAFVAGDHALIEYLLQFTRTYIFTTAIPPALAVATLASLKIVRGEPWRRQRLVQLVERFREAAGRMGLTLTASRSPVQAVLLGDAEAAMQASARLLARGLHIPAIRPPTVPQGTARLRVTFSAAHSDDDMDRLLDGLAIVSEQICNEELLDS